MPTPQAHANYALSPHLATLFPASSITDASHSTTSCVALIDAGQIQGLEQRIRKRHPASRCHVVYENTFAENVRTHSPLLIELSSSAQEAQLEIGHLDALSADLPIMSLLRTREHPLKMLTRLRTLLRLQMDGTDYLWRLADTQILLATASVLEVEQLTNVFGQCTAWWIMTADGTPRNLACAINSNGRELDQPAPLKLNANQERDLLAANMPQMLASQMRSLDLTFKNKLTHAEQIRFSMQCIAEARNNFLDEDTELLPWALSEWQKPHLN